jgi:5'-3' exonuclease
LDKLLMQSGLNKQQFIDFCILCGYDYTGRISNIGPMRAYKLLL